MRTWALIALAAVAACTDSSPERERYEDAQHHYSLLLPSGWKPATVRDATELAPPDAKRHRIVIRHSEKGTRPDAQIVSATETVLKSLPAALSYSDEGAVVAGQLHGQRYRVTYVPPGLHERFQRTHIVLLGRNVFHIIYTAPAGERVNETALNEVINTLTEEG